MNDEIVKRCIIFLVLMGLDEKVLELSPGYIYEKWEASFKWVMPTTLLIDDDKAELVDRYFKKWAN